MSSVRLVVDGQDCLIRVRGDLDSEAVFQLREEVGRAFARCGSIRVDLTEVVSIDEAGRGLMGLLNSIASPMFRVIPPGVGIEESACESRLSWKSSS